MQQNEIKRQVGSLWKKYPVMVAHNAVNLMCNYWAHLNIDTFVSACICLNAHLIVHYSST